MRHITEPGDEEELSAEQVAGYVAKYATKSTEALGVTLDHRIGEVELEGLDVPAHVARQKPCVHVVAAARAVADDELDRFALVEVGDLHQQLVAGQVAEAVVDPFEAVQVEVQHCGVGAAFDGGGRPVAEQGAVGELGERVV